MKREKLQVFTRSLAVVMAVIVAFSAFEFAALFSTAAPATLDGTFESCTTGELPDGWQVLSSSNSGTPDNTGTYVPNFSVKVVTDDKNSGAKALSATSSEEGGGTRGYIIIQSPAIKITGNEEHFLKFARKIENVDPAGSTKFFGGRVYLVQYDKNGNQLDRELIRPVQYESSGWQVTEVSRITKKDAVTAKIEFYLGGPNNFNTGIRMLIDDVSFAKFTEPETTELLNGDFDSSESNDLSPWKLSSKDIQGNDVTVDYTGGYVVSRVNGKTGKAAKIERVSTGYVSFDSNRITVTKNAAYIFGYSFKIENSGGIDAGFQGIRVYVAEYDKNGNFIKRVARTGYFREDTDWQDNSVTYTPSSQNVAYFRLELWVGAFKADNRFIAYFDDVTLFSYIGGNSDSTVANGGFEAVHEGTIFDWTFGEVAGVTYSSVNKGYIGKGLQITSDSKTVVRGNIRSNTFNVKAGTTYKAQWMALYKERNHTLGDSYAVLNVYFYDAGGNPIKYTDIDGNVSNAMRINEYDFRGGIVNSKEWQQITGFYTAPKGAVKCMLEYVIPGFEAVLLLDEVKWSAISKDTNQTYGFEKVDANGNPLGWYVDRPADTKIDTTIYAEGKQSLFISGTSETDATNITCDYLIPVKRDSHYKFTAQIKSYGSVVNSEGIRLNAKAYDKNGKYLGTIEGLRFILDSDNTVGEWKELICGVKTSTNIAYIRPIFKIAPGTINLWIDDVKWEVFDMNNEFLDDFTSVTNEKLPLGWNSETVSGEPEIIAKDSILTIKGKTDNDKAKLYTRWDTHREYTYYKYTTTYQSTTDVKLTFRYYDFTDREIVEDRYEYVLKSTNGQVADETFEFYFPSAKYTYIEMENLGKGYASFDGIQIVVSDGDELAGDELDNTNWRGYWIWHYEDYLDSVNSTPRYFRYHVNIPGTPALAGLQITADDNLDLYINGQKVSDDQMLEHWGNISVLEGLEQYFHEGDNLIAVAVKNFTSFAGLIFDGYVETEDEQWIDFYSTEDVVAINYYEENWNRPDYDDSKWPKTVKMEDVGGPQWGDIAFDGSPFVERVFEVIDYTVTTQVDAGGSVDLTMTIIPEEAIEEPVDLSGSIWIRNTQTKVLTLSLTQSAGPKMKDWKAGEQITVTYSFEIPDFVATGRYIIQLDTALVRISNVEVINNKLVKAINVSNVNEGKTINAKFEEINGTFAFNINGDIYPNISYCVPNRPQYSGQGSTHTMHEAGICITRLWTRVGNAIDNALKVWTNYGEYDWEVLDNYVYEALSDHPDTYLMLTVNIDAPKWWCAANPNECVISNTGENSMSPSFGSDKFWNDAMDANKAMIEHMQAQPYWSRVVGIVLGGCRTYEWLWYGNGSWVIDCSEAGLTSWRNWLEKKYGTDEALRKAWNDNSVSIKTAKVPTDERYSSTYETWLDPVTQQSSLDHAEYLQQTVANRLKYTAAQVTEWVDDKLIIGAYYGYLLNRVYLYNATQTLHTAVDEVLDDENIDFFGTPALYDERYDGEVSGSMAMVDSVLAHGKAVMVEDDLRLCPFFNTADNFYTRDTVGPTYNVSDSLSQLTRNFAVELTSNIGNWYLNLNGMYFERKQFADLLEIMNNEATVNLSREKDCDNDVCYIIDADMYEKLAYSDGNDTSYELLYWLVYEQRFRFARMGTSIDCYTMGDLVAGLVPDHKVYFMLSAVEMTEDERKAVDKYLKNDGKIVVWEYMNGASDGETFTGANMSEVIGMDVKIDNTPTTLSAVINDKSHWLTEGLSGTFYGNSVGKETISPIAVVTDKEAQILAYMSDGSGNPALAVKEFDDWTSIYSVAPDIRTNMIRNILKKCNVHTYSNNPNDVVFANSNYVAINVAHGGDRELKLDGTYAVYDVFGMKTISLSTDTIKFNINDNSTKIFRLTPVDKHVVFVDVVNSKGTSGEKGWNEVSPGEDYSCTIKAKDGYMLSSIVIDGVATEIFEESYTVTFEDVDNSHFVKATYKRVAATAPDNSEFPWWIIWTVGGVLLAGAGVFFVLFFLKKKKEKEEGTLETE